MIEPTVPPETSDVTQTQGKRAEPDPASEYPRSPPAKVPGYQIRQLIGSGAYGEVWEAVDQNTKRLVAIKFYTHQGGLDRSLLSTEVDKLVRLSADRYVVQLLDVGWSADPPYYVMEHMPNGSLADLLHREGSLAVPAALETFRDIAVGISHAHSKGILHCDLKPANLLLDQDNKPRLADFGQSRLSHEQRPALGTLFYMAPEQADMNAIPTAGWDVYALGALFFCMLTGRPPYRDPAALSEIDSVAGLEKRLAKYRAHIHDTPRPTDHREVAGVDRHLAEIIDGCLEVDEQKRFSHVINIIDALDSRDRLHRRRPLLVLGILGPLLLMITMGIFGYRGYQRAMRESEVTVTVRARESNVFAAQFAAETVSKDLEKRFRIVQDAARDTQLRRTLEACLTDATLAESLARFAETTPESDAEDAGLPKRRDEFRRHPKRQALDDLVKALHGNPDNPSAASWFVQDHRGISLAISIDADTDYSPLGRNFAYRTYFHGGERDLPKGTRAPKVISAPHLSSVFRSTTTDTWKLAISTPVVGEDGSTIGVIALTLEVGEIEKYESKDIRFATLIDGRDGDHRGVILQHPLFDELKQKSRSPLPDFSEFRADVDLLKSDSTEPYIDPLSTHELGEAYRRKWVGGVAPVRLYPGNSTDDNSVLDTGLLVLVQEDYQLALAPVANLGRRLLMEGMFAVVIVVLVLALLWVFVYQLLKQSKATATVTGIDGDSFTLHSRETMEFPS